MELIHEKTDCNIIVYVRKPMDIGFSPIVENYITDLIRKYENHDFIVNLEKVGYINSTGLGVLIFCSKKLKENDHLLKVVSSSEAVKKVINILNANDILLMFDSDEKALAHTREG